MTSHAAIIGGGIGGLAAAVALRRAGLDVTVFERQPSGEAGGTALSIAPNGMHALRRLGVGNDAEACGVNYRVMQMRDPAGRVLAETPAEDARSIRRADLVRILLDALPAGTVRWGLGCTGLSEVESSRPVVRLSDGTSASFDIVIGADGLHSLVREALLGSDPPLPAGYTAVRAIMDGTPPGMPERIALLTIGEGATFGYFPLEQGQTYWYATLRGDARSAGLRDLLLDRYRRWHAPIVSMIEATPEARLLPHEIFYRRAAPVWGKGHVTLLGDAAHPMSPALGQGACQALEDSVALGAAVESDGASAEALRRYEAARMPHTARVADRSHRVGQMVHLEPPAAWVRDAVLRVFGRKLLNQRTWIVTYRV